MRRLALCTAFAFAVAGAPSPSFAAAAATPNPSFAAPAGARILSLAAPGGARGPTPTGGPSQRSHLVVIVGAAAGDDVYEEVFHNWALQLVEAATQQLGMAPDQVTYLGANPELHPDTIDAKSSRENVEQTLTRLADESSPDDRIFIVLIGHGSGEGEQSKFNIPGRDISAVEYDALLDRFVTQAVGFINTASASGDFTTVLAAPNRVIVTATRDGRQYNQTVFPRFFVEAFAADVADLDKDGRISLLEAYHYARREVKRFYDDDGRMLTETSLLEDNGDGEGSHDPTGGEVDGSLARLMFFDNPMRAGATEEGPMADDPEMRKMYEDQRRLRIRIEELKLLKDTMDAELYAAELEELLIALARTDAEIRARGGRR